MAEDFETTCPVYRPSRAEFSKGFLNFVENVTTQDPNVAMFKVIPPDGWKPTKRRPNLDKMMISTPIQQLAFGKQGSYRCMLIEQKALSVADFRNLALSEERLPPVKCRENFKEMERAFWKSVTMNPPLYGADTPISLFDEKIANGWSLRHLDDLLKAKGCPDIPGVTSPMTYFGMWKSFFAWHLEDADLYSVNFLHWGAPKIWYCVSPKDKAKFERVAQSMNPDLHHRCKGFLRHKDVLISPSILRQYNVEFQQCKQEENEFVVLNAGAYHSGFNCGYNTAEAVNFALENWVEQGKRSIPCTCDALGDAVRIDMRLFESNSDLSCSEASTTEAAASSDEGSDDESESDAEAMECSSSQPEAGADADAGAFARARGKSGGKRRREVTPEMLRRGAKGDFATPDGKAAKAAKGTPSPCSADTPLAKCGRHSLTSQAAAKPLRSAASKLSQARKISQKSLERFAQLAAGCKPMAIVGTHDGDRGKFFHLVQQVDKASSKPKHVVLQWLREGRDGLFRPTGEEFEEEESTLVAIRTQLLNPGANKAPGFKLLTLRSRILDTELVQ